MTLQALSRDLKVGLEENGQGDNDLNSELLAGETGGMIYQAASVISFSRCLNSLAGQEGSA